MTSPVAFPRRALLLGTLWLPVAGLALFICSKLGLAGSDHWRTHTFVVLAAVFLAGALQELVAIARALRAVNEAPALRSAVNWLALIWGVLIAAFSVVLFVGMAQAAYDNLQGFGV